MRASKSIALIVLLLGAFIPTTCLSQSSAAVPMLVTGPGMGGGPRVRLFNPFNGPGLLGPTAIDFFAFSPAPFRSDPGFRGGTRVGLCDINGDHNPDILAFPGYGGGPRLQAYDGAAAKNGQVKLIMNMMVYEDDFRGGGWVTGADFNNDDHCDIVVGAGTTGGSRVRVFSGKVLTKDFPPNDILAGGTGSPPLVAARMADFFAYTGPSGEEGSGRFGVTVAAGDVNGDGVPDIITGADLDGGPHVKAVNGVKIRDGALLAGELPATYDFTLFSFMAFQSAQRKGVYLAVADVNGDGYADIVAGTPTSLFDNNFKVLKRNEGLVRVYNGKWFTDNYGATGRHPPCVNFQNDTDSGLHPILRPNYALPNPQCLVVQFKGFEEDYDGPIYVSAADLDRDGKAEVFITAGETGGPRTTGFYGATLMAAVAAHANLPDLPNRPTAFADFFAYETDFRGGAHSAAAIFWPKFGTGK